MKNGSIVALILLLGAMVLTLTNCSEGDDPLKSCSQEEICTAKNVTACCDEDVCTYQFDGKEYSEAQLDELADDLGCASSARLSADSEEREQLINQLRALVQRAKSGLE
ncbi:hypothetical protein R9C00_13255 [Flammeovirgaceae bacterium SG7u.111]|nr:hypothetical protein [Flammeovirgaceae bacterium SG7u.132]WPO38424.1 hypothetical protein R9C00_13255 [Flammeovirgaceae bacterium SG7u.111]